MKLGIKVSLQPYALNDLSLVHPEAAEVWFDVSRAIEYEHLFKRLRELNVETGLHFWGALPDGTMANISYPDTELNTASLKLMEKAVDIAAANGFVYVNIHPGQRARVKVNFRGMNYPSVSGPAELRDAIPRFLENVAHLSRYAQEHGVVFTVETVSKLSPATDWYNPASRLHPINIYDLPIEAVEQAAQSGIRVANDFVHTATHALGSTRTSVWSFLAEKTRELLPATKLIHLGFLVPPYNGVDNHDMLYNPVFDTPEAIPNRTEAKELLALFKGRDVWVITEPRAEHAKNYFLAQKLLPG